MKTFITSVSFLLFFGLQFSLVGQVSFSHAIGGTYFIGTDTDAPTGTYSPRLNFMELGDEMTLSVGTHASLGFSANSRSGGSFAFDLPVVVEANFGNKAHREADSSSLGGFFGVGYGINQMASNDEFGFSESSSAGIIINGGVRAIIRDYPLGARLSYLLNNKEGGVNVLGLGLFYNL